MHSRTWLSILSLPLVATFTLPILQQGRPAKAQTSPGVTATPQDPLAGLADIQDVLSLVQQNYVDAPDMGKVVAGGVQAVLERSHPLNAYLSPEDLRLPDPGPGEVGLVVMKRGIYGTVLAVTPGGPAAQAGLQVGDVIRKVNGDSVGLLSSWSLERALRGPVGTTLDLYRYNTAGDLTKTTLTRQRLVSSPITLRTASGATLLTLPDLAPGRAEELKRVLASLDRHQTLVLDLRTCARGSFQEAGAVAAVLGAKGDLGTLQEAGKSDRKIVITDPALPFAKLAMLVGRSTLGPAELLAACLKKGGARGLGEKTPGLAVERSRFPLKQGGAVELVSKRWLGPAGEKLDRQGLSPDQAMKWAETDDVLVKVLEALKAPAGALAKASPEPKPTGAPALRNPHN
jgi:carboxyl-terminal processing protease